jgi:membrane protein YfhO
VALHQAGLEDLTVLAEYPSLFEAPARVFAVPRALPRAFAVTGVRTSAGPPAFATVMDPDFDPSREVLLPPDAARPAPPGAAGAVHVESRHADRVTLVADLTRAGHVVLVDTHDPGWKATVDGRPAPVHQANLAFRAVAVPEGRHRIEFRYRPASVSWGAALSLAGLGMVAALGIRRRRRP